MQMVGGTGCQSANGEKSRIYLAGASLEKADVVVLDETFCALDAETAQQALDCVLRCTPRCCVWRISDTAAATASLVRAAIEEPDGKPAVQPPYFTGSEL